MANLVATTMLNNLDLKFYEQTNIRLPQRESCGGNQARGERNIPHQTKRTPLLGRSTRTNTHKMIPVILIIPVTIAILAISYLKFIIKKGIDSYDVPHQKVPERDPFIPQFNEWQKHLKTERKKLYRGKAL